jgi:anti-anti-sigma factor
MGPEERFGPLVLSAETAGSVRVLHLQGELERMNASEFTRALLEHARTAREVVLDCGGLRFMDSSGLRAILSGSATVRCGISVVGMRPRIARVVELAGCAGQEPFC